ncbi:sulfate adenylyltransferase [miscellaneous Crenarchaeota group-15 archaeon DG-45]|uniref:Sulfate adenylyltransferase n=1 Tax=miscellaneous Crenarchaeota group-15 archaeon DG-45 TaxID=1685127 RepID=A0A0M0BQ63_9ARCH|nr:MAG: sulfate adenylyltransferase [miscellaneous Crenarchaeota group-15 archaeon DG-45]
MSSPHGGRLIDRLIPPEDRPRVEEEAAELPAVQVSEEMRKDFESIAYGVFSPLEGPLLGGDYRSVLERGRLSNDVPWAFPIVLDVPEGAASSIGEGDAVAISQGGESFALLHVEEKYGLDRREHAQRVFGTLDGAHPGVAKTWAMGPVLLGGGIDLFRETPGMFPRYRLKPKETRFLFKELGWRTVAGFQTRNAPHLGHEYVQKTALAFVDGLFINPLIGRKKSGDFTDEAILDAYEALMRHYYMRDSAVLVTLEMEMRYAGPREAIFHAIVRKNFGCTHFVVGRDHAGVGSYYGPYEAQEKFREYPDLGVTPLFFRSFFHCRRCGGVENDKVCPHGPEDRIPFSGTQMRELLLRGERPPREMMRPEVVDAILRHPEPFVR